VKRKGIVLAGRGARSRGREKIESRRLQALPAKIESGRREQKEGGEPREDRSGDRGNDARPTEEDRPVYATGSHYGPSRESWERP